MPNPPTSNVVLIGMPGSGKSTAGVLLAKRLAKAFIDTDLLIQTAEHRTLQSILDTEGYMRLREIEERVLLNLHADNAVISTGGSAAYSEAAMRHLKTEGTTVFLDVSLDTIRERVRDFDTRGVARRPDQSLEELFEERLALYTRYADIRVQSDRLGVEETLDQILKRL